MTCERMGGGKRESVRVSVRKARDLKEPAKGKQSQPEEKRKTRDITEPAR